MAKQNKKNQKEEGTPVNPMEYSYKSGTKIEMDAALFLELAGFVGLVGHKETTTSFPLKDGVPQVNESTVQETISDLGARAFLFSNELEQIHMNNIENKVATHVDELKSSETPVFQDTSVTDSTVSKSE